MEIHVGQSGNWCGQKGAQPRVDLGRTCGATIKRSNSNGLEPDVLRKNQEHSLPILNESYSIADVID